jgi:deoxyuridine 5'-triphosphate nucleotidohydrolase
LVIYLFKALKVPSGNYGRVAPRSGLAHKNFIDVGAGVIDEDYRGELGVILFNFSDTNFNVHYFQHIILNMQISKFFNI